MNETVRESEDRLIAAVMVDAEDAMARADDFYPEMFTTRRHAEV